MNGLRLAGAVMMGVLGLAGAAEAGADAPFVLHAMPGFSLSNPAYRADGDGLAAEVRVCRVAGWAAASPGRLHVQRDGGEGVEPGHRDIALRRLGLRAGENCQRVTARFPGPPRSREHVAFCLAYSHHRCE